MNLIAEVIEQKRRELEREGRDPVGLRGELSALRLVLTIPGILKGEIKSSLKE